MALTEAEAASSSLASPEIWLVSEVLIEGEASAALASFVLVLVVLLASVVLPVEELCVLVALLLASERSELEALEVEEFDEDERLLLPLLLLLEDVDEPTELDMMMLLFKSHVFLLLS